VTGSTSVTFADTNGNTLDPFADTSSAGIPDVTTYITGNDSVLVIVPTDKTLSVTIVAPPAPVAIEIRKGTDTETSQAIRYADVEMPAGAKARIQFTGQGVDILKLDADANGTFETPISPTANVSGIAAADVAPPVLTFADQNLQGTVQVAIAAADSGSGVKSIFYSLDGVHFFSYFAAITVNPLQQPIIYAYAEDNLANRDSLAHSYWKSGRQLAVLRSRTLS